MPLHPQARAAISAQPRVPLSLDNLAAARRSMLDALPAEVGTVAPVRTERDLDAGGVPCRWYDPQSRAESPVIVFAHGGGWVLGGLDTHDGVCRRLARRSNLPVLAVDYRLAPEHPYPAAIEDIETAVGWLRDRGPAELGVTAEGLAIAGDSAGGFLATVVARRARDHGTPYAAQALVYPVIDPEMKYPDLDAYGLDRQEMRFFWDAFAPPPLDRATPDLSPMSADLAGMPPTLVITAEYDILRDEGEEYAARLIDAGVPTTAVRYLGMNHGFFRKLAIFDAAAVAVDQVASACQRALEPAM